MGKLFGSANICIIYELYKCYNQSLYGNIHTIINLIKHNFIHILILRISIFFAKFAVATRESTLCGTPTLYL